jgi:hypothetical protein
MFEKISKCAEEFATELPRRAFFRRVASAAAPLLAVLGGLCASTSHAATSAGGGKCCDADGHPRCRRQGKPCPNGWTPCSASGGPFEGFSTRPCDLF